MTSLLIDGLAFPSQKGEDEHWKEIPGYEGLYEASDCGRIRTCEGKTTNNARYPVRVWKQRILKEKHEKRKRSDHADSRVTLWKDGVEKTLLVSRLVAMAWCDGYWEGATVNHKDGNPSNNSADNLEWVSLEDNIRHGFENGLYPTQKKCTLVKRDGTQTSFRSQSQASLWLGRCTNYVWECVQKNKDATSVDGETYKIVTY